MDKCKACGSAITGQYNRLATKMACDVTTPEPEKQMFGSLS
jgi:hypothetical protein